MEKQEKAKHGKGINYDLFFLNYKTTRPNTKIATCLLGVKTFH